MKDLNDTRLAIDAVDKFLVELLEKRMSLVDEVVAYKKATNKPIFDPEREQKVLEKVANLVKNKDYEATVVATFADIMKNSRDYQKENLD